MSPSCNLVGLKWVWTLFISDRMATEKQVSHRKVEQQRVKLAHLIPDRLPWVHLELSTFRGTWVNKCSLWWGSTNQPTGPGGQTKTFSSLWKWVSLGPSCKDWWSHKKGQTAAARSERRGQRASQDWSATQLLDRCTETVLVLCSTSSVRCHLVRPAYRTVLHHVIYEDILLFLLKKLG